MKELIPGKVYVLKSVENFDYEVRINLPNNFTWEHWNTIDFITAINSNDCLLLLSISKIKLGRRKTLIYKFFHFTTCNIIFDYQEDGYHTGGANIRRIYKEI
jgi:hypothetical protein